MYIKYNGENYTCKCKIGADIRYIGLSEDFPAPVSGMIAVYADDGFLMREDNAEDYLRQIFENGVLTLTNTPEPEPVEIDPEPTVEERVEVLEDALAQTDETAIALFEAQMEQEEINMAQDEALIEIYEMIGG